MRLALNVSYSAKRIQSTALSLIVCLAFAASVAAQNDPKPAKTEKPSRVARLELLVNGTPWDRKTPMPADLTFKLTVRPPSLELAPGTSFRMASVQVFYSDPANPNAAYSEFGKAESSKNGEPLIYRLTSEVIQGFYDKRVKKPMLIFAVTKVIRVLPDGTESEEPIKDKERIVGVPIARE